MFPDISIVFNPEIPTTLSDKGGSSRTTLPPLVRQEMPEDIRKAILEALKKLFQTHEVYCYETICQRLRDLAVSASNNPKADSRMAMQVALAVDSHKEEFKKVISEVTFDIRCSLVSKSSTHHPESDHLRFLVICLLRGVEPGEKLTRDIVLEAARTQLKCQIPNREYLKVMRDLCDIKSSGWVLKQAR